MKKYDKEFFGEDLYKQMKNKGWVEFDDGCLYDPEFAHEHDTAHMHPDTPTKCDNPACNRKYEPGNSGTCLFCQKGKLRPIN